MNTLKKHENELFINLLIEHKYLIKDNNNYWTMNIPSEKLIELYLLAKNKIEKQMNKGGEKWES